MNTYISNYFVITHILSTEDRSCLILKSLNSSSGDIPRPIGVKLSGSFRNTDKATFFICRIKSKVSHRSYVNITCFISEYHTTTLGHRACRKGKFCLFFGGSLRDAAAAAVMGVVIMLVEMIVERTESNSLVVNFIVSLIAGIVAILLVKAGLGVDKDTIMIAGIMILIPGIALTNAVRDMLAGEQATGLLRFTNALLVSAAIAGGFALAIILLGGAL